ncbi:MAG: RNA methyltransferase [Acidobacteriia bacterium]|nr:RNA methyltransferase [Terriglobia bacterium]
MSSTDRAISSRHNVWVKTIRTALRAGTLTPQGLLPIEGPRLLMEAFKSTAAVETVFISNPQVLNRDLERWINDRRIQTFHLSTEVLAFMADTESPAGLMALVKPPCWNLDETLKTDAALFLLLIQLQDPGNMGTILRSAEAFGVSGVISTPGTVNAFNPKSVRASAGSIFRVPLFQNVPAQEALSKFKTAGIQTVATSLKARNGPDTKALRLPMALLVGQEAGGIPSDVLSKSGAQIRIPMADPVQSLNAAIATAILLYEIRRHEKTV